MDTAIAPHNEINLSAISSVIPSAIELDGMGTFDVTFEFGGGVAGVPSLSGN